MVEINSQTCIVSIGPMNRSELEGVVDLYNYSEGYRYATGIANPVTLEDILLKLDRLQISKNEFFSGIFRSDPDGGIRQMIGVVSGVLYEDTLWIKLIAILPQFRRKGLGSAAADLLANWGRSRYQISNMFLSVVEKNIAGLSFWRRQGFSETGRFTKMLFGDSSPYEVVILHKSL